MEQLIEEDLEQLVEEDEEERQAVTLFQQAIENISAKEVASYADILQRLELGQDDPLWAIFCLFNKFEYLARQHPEIIEKILKKEGAEFKKVIEQGKLDFDSSFRVYCNDLLAKFEQIEKSLVSASDAALKIQSSKIASSVNHLVTKAALTKAASNLTAMASLGFILLLTVGAGFAGGWMFKAYRYNATVFAPGEPRQLTLEETDALNWATSEQGQWARNFWQWNDVFLLRQKDGSFRCESEARNFGITINLEGRSAKTGWCALWTQPPEKRTFTKL